MYSPRGRDRGLRAWVIALLTAAVVVSLVPATASAQTRTPSKKTADRLAKRLLSNQLKDEERQLVEARVSEGVRHSNGTWTYLYDDLARNGDICTASIVVKFKTRTSTTITASFKNSNCENPGPEVLAFRTQSRTFERQLLRRGDAVIRSIDSYSESLARCESLDVPAARETQVEALLFAGLVQATLGPLDSVLDSHATALQAIGAQTILLRNGANAYRDYVDALRAIPDLDPDACSLLRQWDANDWTAETAPVDFAALTALVTRLDADSTTITKSAKYLVRSGVDRLTAQAFAADGLIIVTTNEENASKLVRRVAR